MQRKQSRNLDLDITELGAFVDTAGTVKSSKKRSKSSTQELDSEILYESQQIPLHHDHDPVEEKLESLVFGSHPFHCGGDLELESDEESEDDSVPSDQDEGDIGLAKPNRKRDGGLSKRKAWHDEDDDDIRVDIIADKRLRKLRKSADETVLSGPVFSQRLRSQFEKLQGQPEWASVHSKRKRKHNTNISDSESDSDDERDILRTTGNMLASSVERLPKEVIAVTRLKDANSAKRAQSVVRALEFHPTANVLLTAGYHKTLDLFQVDGQVNPKLQSVHLERFPICTAHFTRDGTEVIMAGQRRSFFVYDMVAGKVTQIPGIRGREERFFDKFVISPDNQYLVFLGKDGYMPIVSNKTKQWIGDLKMNGRVRDVTFTPDSRHLLSIGTDGKVYIWDTNTRDCISSFTDEGCIVGTRLAVSPNGQYLACGSDSGVVNIYNSSECLGTTNGPCHTPKPVKSVMNLTTCLDHMCFNATSEILAISSQRKKDALKLVHMASLTVFSNWPTLKTPLSCVSSLAISPHSRYLAIGNDKGRALLYRLNHFHDGFPHI